MWIENLNLKKFGKFEDHSISFSPKLNLILGDNEAGKTMITHAIDAIYNGFSPANHNYKYVPFNGMEVDLEAKLHFGEKNYYIKRILRKNAVSKLSYKNSVELFKNDTLDKMIPSVDLSSELLDRKLWYFDYKSLGKKLDFGKWESWKQLSTSLYLENEKFSFSNVEISLQEKISALYTNNSNSKSEIVKCESELSEIEDRIRQLRMREEDLKEIYSQLGFYLQEREKLSKNIEKNIEKIKKLNKLHEYKEQLSNFQSLSNEYNREKIKNMIESSLLEEYENRLLEIQRSSAIRDSKMDQKKEWIFEKERLAEFYSCRGDVYLHLSEQKRDKKFFENEIDLYTRRTNYLQILFIIFSGIFCIQFLFKAWNFFTGNRMSWINFWVFNLFIIIFFVLILVFGILRTIFYERVKKSKREVLKIKREILKCKHDMDVGYGYMEELDVRINHLEEKLKEEIQAEEKEWSLFQKKLLHLFGSVDYQECKKKLDYAKHFDSKMRIYQSDLDFSYEKIGEFDSFFFEDIILDKKNRLHFDETILKIDIQESISNYHAIIKNQKESILEISRQIGSCENKLSDLECIKLPSYEMKKEILKEQLKNLKKEYSIFIFLKEIFIQMRILSYRMNRPDFEICLNRYFEEFLSEKKFDIRLNSQKELDINRIDFIENLDIDQISTGTLSQIYFLLKLSLLEKTDPKCKIPVVIDGAFDHYDVDRTQSMMKILQKISSQRQVILLNCREIDEFEGKIIKIRN